MAHLNFEISIDPHMMGLVNALVLLVGLMVLVACLVLLFVGVKGMARAFVALVAAVVAAVVVALAHWVVGLMPHCFYIHYFHSSHLHNGCFLYMRYLLVCLNW